MRITTRSMHSTILTNLNKINEDMYRINTQISSGKQFSKISDDPVGVVTSLGFRSNISLIEQYQENLQFGDKAISAAENSLTQMKEIAMRAKTLGLQLANGSMTPENRLNASSEVQQLFEETITLANTSVNGKYLFGGYRTTGYTDIEPTPFIQDAKDGHTLNGSTLPAMDSAPLTGTVLSAADAAAANITAGDLLINGVDVANIAGAIDLTTLPDIEGINMQGAWNASLAINDQEVNSLTGTTASLSSPYAGVAATNPATASRVAFHINGYFVDVNPLGGPGNTDAMVAQDIVAAINALPAAAGVTAEVGTGANGGVLNSVIIRNSTSGDTAPIDISGLSDTEKTITGFTNNTSTEGVRAKLTTLYAGAAATVPALPAPGDTTSVFFYLNGVPTSFTIDDTGTTADAADATVAAINAISDRTGVTAVRGDGTNGGAADSVVLYNTLAGDESNITITGYTLGGTSASTTGLGDIDQAVGNNNNTGAISLSSPAAFELTSGVADDSILNLLGLDGGNLGFADEAGDGALLYGARLNTGDLTINNIAITTANDTISDIYQDISAAAKAEAINSKTGQTKVSAEVVPAILTAAGAVQAGSAATGKLTGTVSNADIAAGDLRINGTNIPQIDGVLGGAAVTNGLNTGKAYNAKLAFDTVFSTTGVAATLTTLYAGTFAADPTATTTAISFELNGVTVNVNATGTTANEIAQQVVGAINSQKSQTGVTAVVGNGANGGVTDSIVLHNTMPGDETPILVSGIDAQEDLRIGMADTAPAGQIADATHNTGQIILSSDAAFTLSSPNNTTDDLILRALGLDGGEERTGISGDTMDDGRIDHGATPVYLNSGDLVINGVDIFTTATSITSGDSSNAMIDAINAKTAQTGIKAGRNNAGQLILSATDGRNMHIETSALGEKVSRLTGNAGPQDQVYFGELRLWGGNEFFMESAITPVGALSNYETGFNALGVAGGSGSTGQTSDIADDGKIFVDTIDYETGYVRYAGDRDNDFAIKVGQKSTIAVAKNGETAVMDTGLFTVLRNLQSYFREDDYKTLSGGARATDTTALLNSGETGLELEDELQNGSFTISITSHDTSPAKLFTSVAINIDVEKDSLEDIANRINGVPGISASWSDDGHLQINSDDPDRYTFALGNDTSNFLRATGSDSDNLQTSNIEAAIGDLDVLMQQLTDQVSDFGARANRIIAQQQIYLNLHLATKENLSEAEDTDLTQAVMDIKSKELAYQAALAAAAKTMQLSLVDFLK